jgi:hypothetical protein
MLITRLFGDVPRQSRSARYLRVLLTALSALGLVICARADVGLAQPSAAEAPPNAQLRDCRSRAEGTAPIKLEVESTDVKIGPLVLGNVRSTRGVGRTGKPDWPFVRKTPVLLPARARVVLAIAPEAITRAAFQHRGGWVSAIRFTACFERVRAFAYRGTVGPTTFFPFAIGLQERTACIPMDMWVEGRSAPVRRVVPLGRRSC